VILSKKTAVGLKKFGPKRENSLASEIAGDGGADKRTEQLGQEDPTDVSHV